jgi:Tfp pilus assembly protein PilF
MSNASDLAKAEGHYYTALDLFASGDAAAAIAEFEAAITADPTFHDARHGLTRALQETGNIDRAIEEAQKIVSLDPDDVLSHTSLSILYQAKGMIAEAEAESAKARILGWKYQLKEQKKNQQT